MLKVTITSKPMEVNLHPITSTLLLDPVTPAKTSTKAPKQVYINGKMKEVNTSNDGKRAKMEYNLLYFKGEQSLPYILERSDKLFLKLVNRITTYVLEGKAIPALVKWDKSFRYDKDNLQTCKLLIMEYWHRNIHQREFKNIGAIIHLVGVNVAKELMREYGEQATINGQIADAMFRDNDGYQSDFAPEGESAWQQVLSSYDIYGGELSKDLQSVLSDRQRLIISLLIAGYTEQEISQGNTEKRGNKYLQLPDGRLIPTAGTKQIWKAKRALSDFCMSRPSDDQLKARKLARTSKLSYSWFSYLDRGQPLKPQPCQRFKELQRYTVSRLNDSRANDYYISKLNEQFPPVANWY